MTSINHYFTSDKLSIATWAAWIGSFITEKRSGLNASRSARKEAGRPNQIRKTLTTNEAAALLNRKPQTLRKWACLENAPIRPVRIHGRLAWYEDEIASLLD